MLARAKKRTMETNRRGERGVYFVWFALSLPVLVILMGLAVDMAHFRLADAQLQDAANAAALAGAKSLNGLSTGRAESTQIASTYAKTFAIDGKQLADTDVVKKETGTWSPSTGGYTTSGMKDLTANAVRVKLKRDNVGSYFSSIFSDVLETRSFAASAMAVAGGAGMVSCAAPLTIAACALRYDSSDALICPDKLSLQNGALSVGLTLPDGSAPVNGARVRPIFKEVVTSPLTCQSPLSFGTELYLSNGNDLQQASVNDINSATNNGARPVEIIVPVTDVTCATGGTPNYNGTATVVGFIKMNLVGGRWTNAAPQNVAKACPTLGQKNVCVTKNCSFITGTVGGGTVQADPIRVYLVR